MIDFTQLVAGHYVGLLGYIPSFLSENDPRPAREQINKNYSHGGGWRPSPKWQVADWKTKAIEYPGSPPMKPVAFGKLRNESIFVYPGSWVGIFDDDGHFEVSRID